MSGVLSDDFEGPTIGPWWAQRNDTGQGSYAQGGGVLSITANAGIGHDTWTNDFSGVYLYQQMGPGDFDIAYGLNAIPGNNRTAGCVFVEDISDPPNVIQWRTWDTFTISGTTRVFAGQGTPGSQLLNLVLPAPLHRRISKVGNTWTYYTGLTFGAWTQRLVSVTGFAPSAVALWAGNIGTFPEQVAQFTYFRNLLEEPTNTFFGRM